MVTAMTVMVATMHPGLAHTDESISTCRFAQRVAKVTNVAEINEEVDQAALIEKLKQENWKLREEGGMADDAAEVQLGPEELASLHAALRTFVRDPDAHATVTWPASTWLRSKSLRLSSTACPSSSSKTSSSKPYAFESTLGRSSTPLTLIVQFTAAVSIGTAKES